MENTETSGFTWFVSWQRRKLYVQISPECFCVTFSCSRSETCCRRDITSANPATRPALCTSCSTFTLSVDFSMAPASVCRQIFDFSCCLHCRSVKRSESRCDDFTWSQMHSGNVDMQIQEMALHSHVGHIASCLLVCRQHTTVPAVYIYNR